MLQASPLKGHDYIWGNPGHYSLFFESMDSLSIKDYWSCPTIVWLRNEPQGLQIKWKNSLIDLKDVKLSFLMQTECPEPA